MSYPNLIVIYGFLVLIIDQHTILAFAHCKELVPALNTNGRIIASSVGIIQVSQYIQWIKELKLNRNEMFMVDRILFDIGKHNK